MLLLEAADTAADARQCTTLISEAVQTVELLKTVEIESYFLEDDCVSLLRRQSRSLDRVPHGTAVIYVIPLSGRTEIVLCLASALQRITVAANADQITGQARSLRSALQTPGTREFLKPAQQLSQWLLQPLKPVLKEHEVNTLVFVPDAALRGVPMSALHDGRHFLAEEFTIAISPGLTLLGGEGVSADTSAALLCGISKPVQDHSELKHVPAELREISRLFPGPVMLDEQFEAGALARELARSDSSIVHIASHAQFGGEAQQSYILAFDGRLTIERLEEMISPRLLSKTPIELLALSACQTAAGDERSALGLAGVAIKSGARSTLATLWSVNDESSQRLMTAFYSALKSQPKAGKARALQSAQRQLLADPQFNHPFFWSSYILIGDWL